MKRAKTVLQDINNRLNEDFSHNQRDPSDSDNEHYIFLMRSIQVELNEWIKKYNPLG